DALELLLKVIQLLVRQLLQADEARAGAVYAADQLIELQVQRLCVAVLGVLDQEDHEERDDRGARVDHQLPGIREAEGGSGCRPGSPRPPGTSSSTARGTRPASPRENSRAGSCCPQRPARSSAGSSAASSAAAATAVIASDAAAARPSRPRSRPRLCRTATPC